MAMETLHAINAMEAEKLTAQDVREPVDIGLVISAMVGESLIVIVATAQARLNAKNVVDQAKLNVKNVVDREIITVREGIDTIAVPVMVLELGRVTHVVALGHGLVERAMAMVK